MDEVECPSVAKEKQRLYNKGLSDELVAFPDF
jgi:hypothetical protein